MSEFESRRNRRMNTGKGGKNQLIGEGNISNLRRERMVMEEKEIRVLRRGNCAKARFGIA